MSLNLIRDNDKHTKERRMRRHVCALQHLRKAAERANNVLNQLESRCGALTEGLGEAVWVSWHAHAPVHASHTHTAHATIHASHATHAAIHGSITATISRVR